MCSNGSVVLFANEPAVIAGRRLRPPAWRRSSCAIRYAARQRADRVASSRSSFVHVWVSALSGSQWRCESPAGRDAVREDQGAQAQVRLRCVAQIPQRLRHNWRLQLSGAAE